MVQTVDARLVDGESRSSWIAQAIDRRLTMGTPVASGVRAVSGGVPARAVTSSQARAGVKPIPKSGAR
jgi:hypothetical protein